eukprot:TRINITY_DN2859_c0_g1_i2.p1 TRINITY_DN2859_c0_g1~~TRINITY_DN2859_c0_g1_i2.p1  ORF type:complete len:984 (+),score=175.25 TRINITY_DN2859_c0_g1_i2:44-2995(+)
MISAVLLGATALCTPLPATRLRCEGSLWGNNYPSYSYAIKHDKELTFTWEPKHKQERVVQKSYQLRISDGSKLPIYDTGIVNSVKAVHTAAVSSLESGKSYEWELLWSDGNQFSDKAIGQFHTGLTDADWTGVPWLGSNNSNLHRSEFTSLSNFAKATLYVAGLSYSHTTINGEDVSNSVLVSSPWTNYERIVGYSSFDVTDKLKNGAANVIGIELGYGWRNVTAYSPQEPVPGDNTERCFRVLLQYQLANGSLVNQPQDWSQSAGPVVSDSVWNGETYDSRKEQPGWNTASFTQKWPSTDPVNGPAGTMVPWSAPSVAVSSIVKPIGISSPKPGYKVVDFGINQAGVVRIKNISISSGDSIVLKFAEVLQHAGIPGITPIPGMVYRGNLRSAEATDIYIGNGSPNCSYMAKFTYHGFRYVEVTGSEHWTPTLDNIEMVHFHSAVEVKTEVKFSSPLLNGMQKLAVGTQRSNMMSLLTDCDQRDERLGWMGDAALSAETIAINYDANSFLKFAMDMHGTEVDSDGSLPDIVPWVRGGSRPGDVSWTLAFPEEIHANWKINNDTTTARIHFDKMVRNQQNIASQAKSAGSLGHMKTLYGDWVPPPKVKGNPSTAVKPARSYTSAFSYLTTTRMVGEVAVAIGNDSVAAAMKSELTSLNKQFNEAFYSNGIYDINIDTDNSLALALGTDVAGNETAQKLVTVVRNNTHHFYTGIIGFKFLFDSLYNFGYEQDALAVLETTDYPSIGYMLTNILEPATSNVWELIDGPFEGPGMNSRNHHMYSSYSSYLVRKVAGIDILHETGVVSLFPAPHIDLTSSTATMQLANGIVTHSWRREGGVQCAKGFRGEYSHPDANELKLSCGSKGTIEEVMFASYGQPSGVQCGDYVQHPTCHHSRSVEVTERECLGKNECVVDLKEFRELECGDHMRATVRCSNEKRVLVSATIPIGTEAKIHIPQGATLVGSDGKLFTESPINLESGVSHFTLQ